MTQTCETCGKYICGSTREGRVCGIFLHEPESEHAKKHCHGHQPKDESQKLSDCCSKPLMGDGGLGFLCSACKKHQPKDDKCGECFDTGTVLQETEGGVSETDCLSCEDDKCGRCGRPANEDSGFYFACRNGVCQPKDDKCERCERPKCGVYECTGANDEWHKEPREDVCHGDCQPKFCGTCGGTKKRLLHQSRFTPENETTGFYCDFCKRTIDVTDATPCVGDCPDCPKDDSVEKNCPNCGSKWSGETPKKPDDFKLKDIKHREGENLCLVCGNVFIDDSVEAWEEEAFGTGQNTKEYIISATLDNHKDGTLSYENAEKFLLELCEKVRAEALSSQAKRVVEIVDRHKAIVGNDLIVALTEELNEHL